MTDVFRTARELGRRALEWVGLMSPEPTKKDEKTDWLNTLIDDMRTQYNLDQVLWEPIYASAPEYLRGDQTRELNIPEGFEPIQDNVIAPLVNQDAAMLASRQPDVSCSPLSDRSPETIAAVEAWEGHLRYQFRKGVNVPMLLVRAHDDAATFGWWVSQAWWDRWQDYDDLEDDWRGGVSAKLAHPLTFRGDPQAEHWKDMGGRFCVSMVATNDLLRRYTDRAGASDEEKSENARKRAIILAEAMRTAEPGNTDGSSSEWVTRRPDANDNITADRVIGKTRETAPGRVLDALNATVFPEYRPGPKEKQPYASTLEVFEGIWDDYTTEPRKDTRPIKRTDAEASGRIIRRREPMSDAYLDYDTVEGKFIEVKEDWPTETIERERAVYPHGRHVIRVGDKGIIEDEPWPYEHPLWTLGLNGFLPHTWRGENDIERARPAQDAHNLEEMQLANFKRNFLALILKVAEGANPEDKNNKRLAEFFRTRGGAAVSVTKEGFNGIGFVEPPSLAGMNWLQGERENSRQVVKDQMGIHNVSEGKETEGDRTLGEVQIIAANDRYRTGLKGILIDEYITDLMEQVYELCQKHLNVGDRIRVIDERGSGGYVEVTQEMLDVDFDITLSTTTALPMDKERRRMEAVEFVKQVAVLGDPRLTALAMKWLVKAFDPPDIDDILALVDQWIAMGGVQQPARGQASGGTTTEATKPAPQPEPQAVATGVM